MSLESQPQTDFCPFYNALLGGDRLGKIWDQSYPSRRDQNPAKLALDQMQGLSVPTDEEDDHHDHDHDDDHDHHPLEDDPKAQALSFVREILKIEYGALAQAPEYTIPLLGTKLTPKTPDAIDLEKKIGRLYHHLLQADLPPRGALPRQHRMMLDLLERQTYQKEFHPVKTIKDSVHHMFEHIAEEAKNHPVSFSALMMACTAMLLFMNRDLSAYSSTLIDPDHLRFEDVSLDDLISGAPLNFDPLAPVGNFEPTCHDHLAIMIGRTLADVVKSAGDLAGIFPQDCPKVMSYAANAQESLNSTYGFLVSRLGIFIEDPALRLGASFPDSHFMRAFMSSASYNADLVYKFDTIENIVLHSSIFMTTAFSTYKLGTLEKGEAGKLRRQVTDFLSSSVRSRPLNYVFSLAAAGSVYQAQNGFTPETAWAGLGGLVVGHLMHNMVNRHHRAEHAQHVLENAIGSLQTLTQPSDKNIPDIAPEIHKPSKRKAGRAEKILTRSALGAAFTAAAIVGADISGMVDSIQNEPLREMMINVTERAGAAVALGTVWTSYAVVNIPQDIVQHIVFGLAGAATATPFIALKRGINFFKKKNTGSDHTHLDM